MKIWQWRKQGGPPNFGDEITIPLVQKILGIDATASVLGVADLIGAGSTLGAVVKERRERIPYVWGTGFMWPGSRGGVELLPMDNVLALRGELSLKRLQGRPENITLGDPGLLAHMLVQDKVSRSPRHPLGLVPHYADKQSEVFKMLADRKDAFVIDVQRDPSEVISDIAQCETVLSSSLHGLVVADSLGIPNRRFVVSTKVLGGSFKFYDYWSVFPGREWRHLDPADVEGLSIEEINHLIESSWEPPSNLADIKLGLIESLISRFN